MGGVTREQRNRLQTIDSELSDVRQRLGKLYNLVETTDMEVDDFKPRIRELRERQDRLENSAEEARAALAQRRKVLDDVNAIAAYAREMKDFLEESELTERRAFTETFVKEIIVVPGDALMRYTVPMPYLYPDGDNIDLYCEVADDIVTVTDLAETTGWLRMQSLATRRSPNQNRLISDACITHGVEFYRGMLQARCHPDDDLANVVTRVAQAALRVSDLWFTFRYSREESVPGEVAEYLAENGLEHERAKGITGRSLRVWNVDFHVRTVGRSSLVYVLNTGSRAAANRITDHVVAAWYDLNHHSVGPEALRQINVQDGP